jgi:hypothetical protein
MLREVRWYKAGMNRWTTPTLVLVVVGVAAVAAGCGGGGKSSCQIYEQGSNAYLAVHAGYHPSLWCASLAQDLAIGYGHRWTAHKSASVDYGGNVRRCGRMNQNGLIGVDVYDLPEGEPGGWLCKSLAVYGFPRRS